MAKSKDESKGSRGLNRRAMITGALAVGGAAVVGTAVARPQTTVVAEREWARALARHIVAQLPEALLQLPDIQLTTAQVAEIQQAFQNTLVTNMGCEVPPS